MDTCTHLKRTTICPEWIPSAYRETAGDKKAVAGKPADISHALYRRPNPANMIRVISGRDGHHSAGRKKKRPL